VWPKQRYEQQHLVTLKHQALRVVWKTLASAVAATVVAVLLANWRSP